MVDVIVVGSLNVDTVLTLDRLPKPGESINGLSIAKFPGGKGANQATSLARLGHEVQIIGVVGNDDDGKWLTKNLIENSIDIKYLEKSRQNSTGSAFIIIDRNGNNQIIVFSGANSETNPTAIYEHPSILSDSKFLLMQYEIPIKTVTTFINSAFEKRIPIVINPSPFQKIDDDLYHKIDYMVVNETESLAITGVEITSIEAAITSAIAIKRKGVKNVVITLGSQGAVLCDNSGFTNHLPTFNVHPIDTTASGDAFIGGLLHGLLENYTLEEAVEFANAAGALTTTKMGAQTSLPLLADVNDFLRINR